MCPDSPSAARPRTSSPSRTPPSQAESRITMFARSDGLKQYLRRVGGWGSNPRPADYESGSPAGCFICSELGKLPCAQSCSLRFGTYLARSSLRLPPSPDRLANSGNVIAQSDPDRLVVDAMVGVRGNDPHALDFSPWNLRSCLDDLIWQLGGDVAQTADDGLACEAQRRSASQRSFPRSTSSAAASTASARSARRSSTPLVTAPRPQRECRRPVA